MRALIQPSSLLQTGLTFHDSISSSSMAIRCRYSACCCSMVWSEKAEAPLVGEALRDLRKDEGRCGCTLRAAWDTWCRLKSHPGDTDA